MTSPPCFAAACAAAEPPLFFSFLVLLLSPGSSPAVTSASFCAPPVLLAFFILDALGCFEAKVILGVAVESNAAADSDVNGILANFDLLLAFEVNNDVLDTG